MATKHRASSVDARRSRALLAPRRRLVGRARPDGDAAQVQSGAARLHPRPGRGAFRPRSEEARRLTGLRMLDIGCGGGILSEPLARLGAQMVGADPSRGEYRGGAARMPQESGVAIDYRATTAEALADAGERFDVVLAMEVVEHVADVGAVRRDLRRDGQARRADDRRHPQPHAEELRAGHRRRRIRAALAAARHPPLGQVRHAGRARDRVRAQPVCR